MKNIFLQIFYYYNDIIIKIEMFYCQIIIYYKKQKDE